MSSTSSPTYKDGADASHRLRLWSIGHSIHSYDDFIDLLRSARISAVADVRSRPYSGYNPHFNRDRIQAELESNQIRYVYLGTELGAYREGSELETDATDDFQTISSSQLFQKGLDRLLEGARKYRLAMMCGEKDPMTCHRTHLIERALRTRAPEISVDHLEAEGTIETKAQFESRLMRTNGVDEEDLFMTRDELVTEAYRRSAL